MLQSSPLLAKIRKDIAKRVLRELEKQAEKDPEGFAKFWTEFGAVVKEGIYEDKDMRDAILKLARFRTTTSGDSWTTLGDYVARMKPNQTAAVTMKMPSRQAYVRLNQRAAIFQPAGSARRPSASPDATTIGGKTISG